MNAQSKPLTSLAVLRSLRGTPRPISRSDLAGRAGLTIKRLSPLLEGLIDEGLVERLRDNRRVLYRAKRNTYPTRRR